MKKTMIFITLMITIVFTRNFDSGMTDYYQPDQTHFVARFWGNEFLFWGETEDGYRIEKSADGWYYYAILDKSGDFTSSREKVGIDDPLPESYHLERTQEKMVQINAEVDEFAAELETIASAENWIGDFKLGVILIDFYSNPRQD